MIKKLDENFSLYFQEKPTNKIIEWTNKRLHDQHYMDAKGYRLILCDGNSKFMYIKKKLALLAPIYLLYFHTKREFTFLIAELKQLADGHKTEVTK